MELRRHSALRRALRLAIGLAVTYTATAVKVGSPESVNLSSAKLEEMMDKLQAEIDAGKIPGAAVTVLRGGKLVFEGTRGYRDRELWREMTTDSIVRLMSMSKPPTAVAVMQLIEQGRLKFDDPLAKFHGSFWEMKVDVGQGKTVPANRLITIKDLLLHTAGFGYSAGFNGAPGSAGYLATARLPYTSLETFMDNLATAPLLFHPGERWSYSWSFDVLGYVIQKVTGQPPNEYLRQYVFEPLKMWDTDFYVPASKVSRFSACYMMGPEGNFLIPVLRPRSDPIMSYGPPDFISAGSGLLSTARDYSRFALMLLNGGELDGVRLLRPETVDMMWKNQLPDALLPLNLNGWISDDHTGWGYSWTVSTDRPIKQVDWSDKKGATRTGIVGWGGGTMCNWEASADLDLAIIFTTQRLASPPPNTFQDVVVQGVMASITGPSPRQLPGGSYTDGSKQLTDSQSVAVDANGGWSQDSKDAQVDANGKPQMSAEERDAMAKRVQAMLDGMRKAAHMSKDAMDTLGDGQIGMLQDHVDKAVRAETKMLSDEAMRNAREAHASSHATDQARRLCG